MFASTNCFTTVATLAIAALTLTAESNAAHAAPIVFTNDAAFQALLTNSYLNTFTTVPNSQDTLNFAGNGFAYTISTTGSFGIFSNGTRIGASLPQNVLTWTFTGAPVNAFGGNFFATNIVGAFAVNNAVTFSFSDGSTDTYTPTSASEFRGYVFNAPITSFIISGYPGGGDRYAAIDNLRVGMAVVPEAGSLALLLPALTILGVVVVARKRGA